MERLAREVNEAMQQGWVPTGGLATHRNVFMQAMVKSR
jgi:hypothetical protein